MMASGIEFLVFLVFGLGGSVGAPLGLPPGPEDPLMAAIAPEQCLVYSMWAGSVAPRSDGSVTERWMAQPEIVAAWAKLQQAYVDYSLSMADAEDRTAIRAAAEIARHLMTSSVAFYISEAPLTESGPLEKIVGGVVADFGDQASALHTQVESLVDKFLENADTKPDTLTLGDRRFRTLRIDGPEENRLTWGMLDDRHFAITVGDDEMSGLIARLQTPPPAWLLDLRERLPVPRVSSVSRIDGEQLMQLVTETARQNGGGPEVDTTFERLGLNQFRGFNVVTGLDEDGFLGRAELLVADTPTGLFDLFSDQPLEPGMLGLVGNDRMLVSAAALSPRKLFRLIRDLAGINEFAEQEFREMIDQLNLMAGLNLETDIINQLDEFAYVYGSVNLANPTAGWVLAAGASREMGLTDPFEKIVDLITSWLDENGDFRLENSDVSGNAVLTLSDRRDWAFMPDISWSLANGEIVFSLDKSSIRRHLRREPMASDALVNDAWSARLFTPPHDQAVGPVLVSSVDYSQLVGIGLPVFSALVGQSLPPDLGFSLDDLPPVDVLTREMKPSLTSVFRTPQGYEFVHRQTLPGGSPVNLVAAGGVVSLPAMIQLRRAARRTVSANNIRQLVLAMHNYHDANRALPARFSKDAAGQPLLSWRVHVLPYLEQGDLYRQFHLDEPWDSPHNQALIEKMPELFAHPGLKLEPGRTVYQVPQGPDAIMSDPVQTCDDTEYPTGTGLEQIADGTSQTALVLETSADLAVIWTKPDDYRWEEQMRPAKGLCDAWKNGVNVGLADGSVQFLSFEKLASIFEPLVKKSDGEVVELWDE